MDEDQLVVLYTDALERIEISPDRVRLGRRCPECKNDGVVEIRIVHIPEENHLMYGEMSCTKCSTWITDIMFEELAGHGFTITTRG